MLVPHYAVPENKAVKGSGLARRGYDILKPMIKEGAALSPLKLGIFVKNLESEHSEMGSWSRP